MKEIIEYNDGITLVSHWAQELLGYHSSVIHRPARIMVDVDGITRCLYTLTNQYAKIVLMLLDVDQHA